MASSPLSATTAFTASVSSGGKTPRELCELHIHGHVQNLRACFGSVGVISAKQTQPFIERRGKIMRFTPI